MKVVALFFSLCITVKARPQANLSISPADFGERIKRSPDDYEIRRNIRPSLDIVREQGGCIIPGHVYCGPSGPVQDVIHFACTVTEEMNDLCCHHDYCYDNQLGTEECDKILIDGMMQIEITASRMGWKEKLFSVFSDGICNKVTAWLGLVVFGPEAYENAAADPANNRNTRLI